MLKIILAILFSSGFGGLIAYEYQHTHTTTPPPHSMVAPEIDPAGMVSAFTLLGGALAVLRGRRSTVPTK
jgi:hypothetical protein